MKNILIIALLLSPITFNALVAKNCKTESNCRNNKNCKCWCSGICNFRDKKPDDNPVWVENDPNGKHCYCKQWDLDTYQDRCIRGINVPRY